LRIKASATPPDVGKFYREIFLNNIASDPMHCFNERQSMIDTSGKVFALMPGRLSVVASFFPRQPTRGFREQSTGCFS
jgi:hypothetical protein